MTSVLRQISPPLLRSVSAALAPCPTVLANKVDNNVNASLIRSLHRTRDGRQQAQLQHDDGNSELLHGSREWCKIRPPLGDERDFDTFHRYNTRIGMGHLVFNSKTPITEEVWRTCLEHLTRKMDVMRLCFENMGDDLWLYEVRNHHMDLKVIENKSVMEVAEDLKNEGLDNSFWSVRIIPAYDGELHPIPSLRTELPHQYNLLMRIHHGIQDGNTVGYVMRVYTEILNDVLTGKKVNDDKNFGKFIYDDPLQAVNQEAQQTLDADPLRLEEERARITKTTRKQPLIYSAFPKPEVINPTTRNAVKELTNSHINNLSTYCKSRKITMTAGLEAVFNIALVEMVQDKGVLEDGYEINIRQCVNYRRYMNAVRDFKNYPVGNIYGGMQQGTYSKNVDRKHFWEYAKGIHEDFRLLLKNNGPIIENLVRPQVLGRLDPAALAQGPPRDNSDYCFSNTLDLTPFVFYEGSHVQLTNIFSYNFINNVLYPMLFQYSTYRGFGQLSCSYYTAKIADDTANELMDRIMNVLDFVTE